MMYKICQDCGATLDPGESCDCKTKDAATDTTRDDA